MARLERAFVDTEVASARSADCAWNAQELRSALASALKETPEAFPEVVRILRQSRANTQELAQVVGFGLIESYGSAEAAARLWQLATDEDINDVHRHELAMFAGLALAELPDSPGRSQLRDALLDPKIDLETRRSLFGGVCTKRFSPVLVDVSRAILHRDSAPEEYYDVACGIEQALNRGEREVLPLAEEAADRLFYWHARKQGAKWFGRGLAALWNCGPPDLQQEISRRVLTEVAVPDTLVAFAEMIVEPRLGAPASDPEPALALLHGLEGRVDVAFSEAQRENITRMVAGLMRRQGQRR